MKNISKTNWELVDKLQDKEIDYTDSPEVTEEFFKLMKVREPQKKGIYIKLDTDLIEFFKQHSKHYQTKISNVLEAYKRSYEKSHSL